MNTAEIMDSHRKALHNRIEELTQYLNSRKPRRKVKKKAIKCPYCGCDAVFESDWKIYGREFGMAYICKRFPVCDSYVGVHKGTDNPKGRMANRELREWKKKAHAAFDALWKRKEWTRTAGYRWLSEQLGDYKGACHIGMFDIDMCKKVVEVCAPYLKKEEIK